MRLVSAVLAAVALLSMCVAAQANVFNLGAGLTNLETVRVGDAGNVGELSGTGAGGYGSDRICGAVSYTYNIGKFEVTAAQYCDFLNHKAKSDPFHLYSPGMDMANTYYSGSEYGCNIKRGGADGDYSYSVAADWANRPVNFITYWGACRFVNWLNNGQGDGDTETGAYTLNGYIGYDGRTIQRNSGWQWALPSEDEWYKAAYYKGGGTNAGYWDYATQSNSIPSNRVTTVDGGNNVNFYQNGSTLGNPYWRTNVGEFENSESAYGTFDQSGNMWEWNENIMSTGDTWANRGLRGGVWYDTYGTLRASTRYSFGTVFDSYGNGFRVVQAVPEPSSVIALAGGLLALVGMRRRRA